MLSSAALVSYHPVSTALVPVPPPYSPIQIRIIELGNFRFSVFRIGKFDCLRLVEVFCTESEDRDMKVLLTSRRSGHGNLPQSVWVEAIGRHITPIPLDVAEGYWKEQAARQNYEAKTIMRDLMKLSFKARIEAAFAQEDDSYAANDIKRADAAED